MFQIVQALLIEVPSFEYINRSHTLYNLCALKSIDFFAIKPTPLRLLMQKDIRARIIFKYRSLRFFEEAVIYA